MGYFILGGDSMRKHSILFFLALTGLMVFNSEKAYAGSISASEAKILSAVYATYEYEGEKYYALPEYTQQVRDYLMQDDVDLTEEKCNELLGMIGGNIATAIEEGYLVKKESNKDNKKDKDKDNKDKNVNKNKDKDKDKNKDDDKPSEGEESEEDRKEQDEKVKDKIIQFIENDTPFKEDHTGQEDTQEQGEEEKPGTAEPVGQGKTEGSLQTGQTQAGGNMENNDEQPEKNTQGTSSTDKNKDKKEESEHEDSKEGDTQGAFVEDQKGTASAEKEEESDNVFSFWYRAEEQRRQRETNLTLIILAGIVAMLLLFLVARMFYRQYVLYWSHPRASSSRRPKHLTDIHCHLLPGVDDGSINIEMTKRLLKMEVENGVDTILMTPHFKRGKTRFNNEKLFRVFEEVQEEARRIKPDLKLYLGEELYYDHSLCEAIETGKALKLNNTNYVLVEFSTEVEYKQIHKACQNLIMLGVTPLLAHIERYPALISKTEHLSEIHEMGVYYQMNITTILGSCFSSRAYRFKKLVVDGWIDVFGTDSHDDKSRVPKFNKAWKELLRLCDDEMLETIMWKNPANILEGKDIEL